MKGYDVTVNLPNLPKGAEVQVPGLGILHNGETEFVTEEDAQSWRAANATLDHQWDKDGLLHTEVVPSETFLQVFKKLEGFKVVKAERPDGTESTVVTELSTQEQLPLDQEEGGDK